MVRYPSPDRKSWRGCAIDPPSDPDQLCQEIAKNGDMSEAAPPRSLPPTGCPRTEQPPVIIALASRRYVVVRHTTKLPLRSAEQLCKPVTELQPGESVYYKGTRDRVLASAPY